MSEINVYANRVAAAKEQIRQALSARGLTISASVGLSAYADLITNAIFPGTGDSITATNLTGQSISVGDKVFVKENATVSQSIEWADTDGGNSTFDYVNAAGTYVWGYKMYDIDNETISIPNKSMSKDDPAFVVYDSDNNLWVANWLFGATQNKIQAQDDYYFDVSGTSSISSLTLHNADDSKSWTVSSFTSIVPQKIHPCKIGNKLYLSMLSNSSNFKQYVGTIDNNASTITLTELDSGTSSKAIIYSTADNKLAIGINYWTDTSLFSYSVVLFTVNNDYSLSGFTSSNQDLLAMCALASTKMTFNRNTGILCICEDSYTQSGTAYGMFKYNSTTHDFDTIALTLTGVEDGQNTTARIMTVSVDMSYLQLGRQLFALDQTAGGYKAVPYSSGIGSDVLTGFATSAAAHGSTFTVETVAEAS